MASSPKPSNPADILQTIQSNSTQVGILATELSNRIEQFETWLNSLPGRVETDYWGNDPDGDPCSMGLRLHRAGKKWIISYAYFSDEFDDPGDIEWSPLASSSVEIKAAGIQFFPRLLEAIAEKQQATVAKLKKTQEEFDVFARAIGANTKEAK